MEVEVVLNVNSLLRLFLHCIWLRGCVCLRLFDSLWYNATWLIQSSPLIQVRTIASIKTYSDASFVPSLNMR